MSNKRSNNNEKNTVFNIEVLVFLILSVIFFIVSAIFKEDKTIFIIFIIFGVISFIVIFIIPVKFVFTNKQIRLVWLLSFERVIFWSNIDTIIENNFFSRIDDFANYQIIYRSTYKGKNITKEVQIPLTKKTKTMVEKYAKYKIL